MPVKETDYQNAFRKLRSALSDLKKSRDFRKGIEYRDRIYKRYQPKLNPEGIASMSIDDFVDMIRDINKHHKKRIQYKIAIKDFTNTMKNLAYLLDDSVSIEIRINDVMSMNGNRQISGFHKTGISELLHIQKPEKYGIWNSTRQPVLEDMNIFPVTAGKMTSEVYLELNSLQKKLITDLGIDFWMFDELLKDLE